MKTPLFYRNANASQLLEVFFVSAVTSVLGIRAFLAATNYPQLAGGGLHIAHMLWGGLLMATAIIMLLSSLGKRTLNLAALLGGLGFGAFVDEIGKFITTDNNYFYQPAAAVIYLIFVISFFSFRRISATRALTHKEAVMNALQTTEEVISQNLNETERERLSHYLSQADPKDPVVKALHQVLSSVRNTQADEPSLLKRLRLQAEQRYKEVTGLPHFVVLVNALFLGQGALSLIFIILALIGQDLTPHHLASVPFSMSANILSAVVSLAIIGVGAVYMPKNRLAAYTWFNRALLFDILVTQVFLFYREQFSAATGLVFKILLLVGLQYIIAREESARQLRREAAKQ